LNKSYTGPLLRIEIAGLFYDIYPDTNGKFTGNSRISKAFAIYNAPASTETQATLQTVISGIATVAIWYDQSGNGNNAIQPIAAHRPLIIRASIINQINDRPAILFSGNQYLQMSSNMYNKGITINTVFHTNTTNKSALWSNCSKQLADTSVGVTFSVGGIDCAGNTPSFVAESSNAKLVIQAGSGLPKNITNIITGIVKEFTSNKTTSPDLFGLYINAQNAGVTPMLINAKNNNLIKNFAWEQTAYIGYTPLYNFFSTGNMYEIMVINKSLNDKERLQLEAEQADYYLPNTNYNITQY